jgi:hypothetical protein
MDWPRDGSPGILLDHLWDLQIGSHQQACGTTRATLPRTKRFANRIDVGAQATAHEQQRSVASSRRHQFHQPTNQSTITLQTDSIAQPHSRAHYQGHGHPQNTGLGLDMDLVSLDSLQITFTHDLGVMDHLCVRAASIDPLMHGLGLAVGHFDHWMGQS